MADTYEDLGLDEVDEAQVTKVVDSAFEHVRYMINCLSSQTVSD